MPNIRALLECRKTFWSLGRVQPWNPPLVIDAEWLSEKRGCIYLLNSQVSQIDINYVHFRATFAFLTALFAFKQATHFSQRALGPGFFWSPSRPVVAQYSVLTVSHLLSQRLRLSLAIYKASDVSTESFTNFGDCPSFFGPSLRRLITSLVPV